MYCSETLDPKVVLLNRVIRKKVCESLKTRLLRVDWCVKQMNDKQVNVINLGKGLWEM